MNQFYPNQNNPLDYTFSSDYIDSERLEDRFFKDYEFLEKITENFDDTCKMCFRDFHVAIRENDSLLFANALHKLIGSLLIFITNKEVILNFRSLEAKIRNQGLSCIDHDFIDQIESFTESLINELILITNKWRNKRNLRSLF